MTHTPPQSWINAQSNIVGTLKRFIDCSVHTNLVWSEEQSNREIITKLLGYSSFDYSYYDGPIVKVQEGDFTITFCWCEGSTTIDSKHLPYSINIYELDPNNQHIMNYHKTMIDCSVNGVVQFDYAKSEFYTSREYSTEEKEIYDELKQYCDSLTNEENGVQCVPIFIGI